MKNTAITIEDIESAYPANWNEESATEFIRTDGEEGEDYGVYINGGTAEIRYTGGVTTCATADVLKELEVYYFEDSE